MDVRFSTALPSLCPAADRRAQVRRIALVQMRWYANPQQHREQLAAGVEAAANAGAEIVFLPELTLSRYPADTRPSGRADATAEPLQNGPTHRFAAELARQNDLFVHASLFEVTGANDGRGLNTAIVVSPTGEIVAQTRKLHIPVTTGYYEDHYFAPGTDEDAYPRHTIGLDSGELQLGLPTCWDEWFPEVARCYALAGADLLAYPTAIGSEPDYPAFDTQPLLRQVITGHAIANGLFIAVPNRFGDEGTLSFYGSSFIVDPFGRVLVDAPRDKEIVLVADIDLSHRQDWLSLFPFLATRRPETYSALTIPVQNPRTPAGTAEHGGIPGVAPR